MEESLGKILQKTVMLIMYVNSSSLKPCVYTCKILQHFFLIRCFLYDMTLLALCNYQWLHRKSTGSSDMVHSG